MKYLVLFLTIVGAYAQEESFSAISYGLNNRDIYVINGTYVAPRPTIRPDVVSSYKKMNDELDAMIAQKRQMFELRIQTRELEEQTRLLRKMINE